MDVQVEHAVAWHRWEATFERNMTVGCFVDEPSGLFGLSQATLGFIDVEDEGPFVDMVNGALEAVCRDEVDPSMRRLFRAVHEAFHGLRGVGESLSVVKVGAEAVEVGHIGSCEVRLYRGGVLRPITTPHTLSHTYRVQLDTPGPGGEREAPEALAQFGHVLSSALGMREEMEPIDVIRVVVQPGDVLVLTTERVFGGDEGRVRVARDVLGMAGLTLEDRAARILDVSVGDERRFDQAVVLVGF